MQVLTKAYLPYRGGHKIIDLFGYATKGIPGLDLVGIGKINREIKEKLIFISKLSRVKLPIKRFTICLDLGEEDYSQEELRYLELPLLLCYWALAEEITISNFDECLSCGKIFPDGRTVLPSSLTEVTSQDHTLFMTQLYKEKNNDQKLLYLEELLENKKLKFVIEENCRTAFH